MINFEKALRCIREKAPLIHCITNFVTVNDCANIILATGGSPSMAHHVREVEEVAEVAHGLVCNLGAIFDVEAMILAGKRANSLGKPVILDPVGVGGTQLRRDEGKRLLEEVDFDVIRGNASEIRFLAGQNTSGKGVDAEVTDMVNEEDLISAEGMAKALAERCGSVVDMSGALDVISDGGRIAIVRNGCDTMAKITGSGCMLSSLIGVFCVAMPEDYFAATCAATVVMGVCGEIAEERRIKNKTGNATFRNDIIDGVFNLNEQEILERAKYEVF